MDFGWTKVLSIKLVLFSSSSNLRGPCLVGGTIGTICIQLLSPDLADERRDFIGLIIVYVNLVLHITIDPVEVCLWNLDLHGYPEVVRISKPVLEIDLTSSSVVNLDVLVFNAYGGCRWNERCEIVVKIVILCLQLSNEADSISLWEFSNVIIHCKLEKEVKVPGENISR